jgi:hypothetical protein
MTRLTADTKVIILELRLNESWDTLEVVTNVAKALNIEAGEYEDMEWVRLMHIRNINKEN